MEWLTMQEAAELMGVHQSTVYRKFQAIRGTGHARKMAGQMQVSQVWANANSRERKRESVRKSLVAEQMPTVVDPVVQTSPSDVFGWLQQRLEAAEAERREIREQHAAELARVHSQLQQVQDSLRTLQDQNADLVALNTRLRLQRPKADEAPLYIQELPQERAPEPDLEPVGGEPRADLVAWLRAMRSQ